MATKNVSKKKTFEPLNDRILVQPAPTPGSTIYVPDELKPKPTHGIVLSVGDSKLNLKVGDTVFFGKFAGTEIAIADAKYTVMDAKEILGVIR